MDWFGRAKIDFAHAATPLPLTRKDGSQTDLLKVVEAAVPKCQMNPLLFNGHLQTMYTAVKEHGPQIYYKRKIFDADHKTYAGTFAVDFVVPQHKDFDEELPPRTAFYSEEEFAGIGSDDSKPMLIALHGLSGGSHEIYLRHAITPLVMDGGEWEVCVVNARGCANSKVTTGVLFNARATWDVRQFVKWARKMFPNRPLFGVGFSLGANIMTNYVGEEGANCPLKAAIAVSNPFDLEVSNKGLQRTWLGKEVYSKIMGSKLFLTLFFHTQYLTLLQTTSKNSLSNTRSRSSNTPTSTTTASKTSPTSTSLTAQSRPSHGVTLPKTPTTVTLPPATPSSPSASPSWPSPPLMTQLPSRKPFPTRSSP